MMHINRNANQLASQELANQESVDFESDVGLEDDQLQEADDAKQKKNKKIFKKTKRPSGKSKTIDLLNDRIKTGDFIKDSVISASKQRLVETKQTISRKANEEMAKQMNSFLNSETDKPAKDTVILSQTAGKQQKKESQGKQKSVSTQNPFQNNPLPTGAVASLPKAQKKEASQFSEASTTQHGLETDDEPSGKKKLFNKYVTSLTDTIMNKKQQSAKTAYDLRQSLKGAGVSEKQLIHVENKVSGYLKKEFKGHVKKSFLDYAFSLTKGEMTMAKFNGILNFDNVVENFKEQNIFEDGRQVAAEAREEGSSELRDFLRQSLDEAAMETFAKTNSHAALSQAFDKYNTLAGVAKLNAGGFMAGLAQKVENWGLNYYPNVEKGVVDTESNIDPDSGGKGGQQDGQQQGGESEILVEELRELYIQKAVVSGPVRQIDLRLKINKVKGKLKKLGISSAEELEKIEAEGQAVAKVKLMDLLREGFEERAALPDHKGTSFELVKHKIKQAKKGLSKIGFELKEELETQIKDEINQVMFSLIKEEYLKVNFYLEKSPKNVNLMRRTKNLLKVLERLKDESDIKEDITPAMFQQSRLAADGKVTEAA